MYNPKYINALDVITAPQGSQYTTFTDLDTKTSVEMLVEPSERHYSYSAEYSKLPVKGTANPLLTYQQSEMTLSYPSVLFWTYGNQRDLVPILNQIASFTQPTKELGEPPLLKLTIGSEVWERVRLSKFTYKTKISRDGQVLMAEGSFDVLIDPVPPEQTEYKEAPTTTPVKLSAPEQANAVTQVTKLLDTDVAKAAKYKYTKGKSKVAVAEDGKVSVDGVVISYLKDLLGDSTPPGLNSSTLTTAGSPTKK